eukprot:351003-Rhodomonas_salina.1
MPGTDAASGYQDPVCCLAVVGECTRIAYGATTYVRVRYAMSGTDIAYGARHQPGRRCDVQY